MSTKKAKLVAQEIRYSSTLDYSILPLDFRDFRQALVKNGYELAPVRMPPAPTRIIFSGEIARKQETVIFTDSEANMIGVISKSLTEALSSFADLSKLIAEEIGTDLHKRVKYYQLMAHYRVNSGKLPFQEIPKTENKELIKKLSDIMGEEFSSSSIRLAKKNSSMNQGDWIDVAIEPDPVYEDRYHVGVLFRDSDKQRTETFVKDLETNILKLIELIEA